MVFIAAFYTIVRIWESYKRPSVHEWVEKQWYVYTMEYHSAMKMEAHLTFGDGMDGTGEHCAK